MTACSICLENVSGAGDYHSECLQTMFGTPTLPELDVDLAQLYSLAATKMAGKMSISGAQEKVSLKLSPDRSRLEVAAVGGTYILKPEPARFSAIPQNEHLTMRMAELVSIEVPPCGLIRLRDGTIAYIIKRFDRRDDGTKLPVEDFCQLAGKRLRDKYEGSAELCVKLLRRYATEPLIEIQKFFRVLLFSWWVDNGDMHLKNFSLLTTSDGIRRLSPAYDLLCTRLVIPDDTLAMPIGGKDRNVTRRDWFDFADYCGIPNRAAQRLLTTQTQALERACQLVLASYLPDEGKQRYTEILRGHTATLTGS